MVLHDALLAGLVASAVLLIWLTPHMLYAVLGLLGALLGIAAIYFLQGAAFVAVAHTIMYGGGVLVLMLFSTLMLPLDTKSTTQQRPKWLRSSLTMLLIGGWLLAHFFVYASQQQSVSCPPQGEDAVAELGMQLLGPYALAFEWIGLSLLIALVGATYIMRD